jgi:Amino-transferase class IV
MGMTSSFVDLMDLSITGAAMKATTAADCWCCVAQFEGSIEPTNASCSDDDGENGALQRLRLERLAGYDDPNDMAWRAAAIDPPCLATVSHLSRSKTLDLTKAPDWMEYVELLEGRSNNVGGAGAYDALRCDILLSHHTTVSTNNDRQKSHVWGQEFHLQRLQASYRSIIDQTNQSKNADGHESMTLLESNVHSANRRSVQILQALVQEAEQASAITNSPLPERPNEPSEDEVWVQVVRLTLLWSPPLGNLATVDHGSTAIVVRGHACCSLQPVAMRYHQGPSYIDCALAVERVSDGRLRLDPLMPIRHDTKPDTKVAAWTRLRQTFETPLRYKPAGVAEVLMVRACPETVTASSTNSDDFYKEEEVELLEGISSNVFVVYRDGSIHTAPAGVLPGYVRHLVNQSAVAACGSPVSTTRTVLLSDVSEWQEVFITSSSRLIYPVGRIWIPHMDGHPQHEQVDFQVFWTDGRQGQDDSGAVGDRPMWHKVYDEILRSANYFTNVP